MLLEEIILSGNVKDEKSSTMGKGRGSSFKQLKQRGQGRQDSEKSGGAAV